MFLLILIWSLDVVAISAAMETINQIFLLCFRYAFALPVVTLLVFHRREMRKPDKKDIGKLIVSMLFGDVLYFYCEYSALKYLPVGVVTVLLGFLPAASYLTDSVIEKKKPKWNILLAIAISIVGLAMVVMEENAKQTNNLIGYFCCAGCVIVWIIYGYLTRNLHEKYSSTSITLYQMSLAVIFTLPIALMNMPKTLDTKDFMISIIVMGILSSGVGCLIEVKGLIDLGTTVSGVYLNLLPVFSAITGMIFLHESMNAMQIIGSVLVVLCGVYINIRIEKSTG